LAKELQNFLAKRENYPINIMGIINANSDSFYKNSRFIGDKAISQIETLIKMERYYRYWRSID